MPPAPTRWTRDYLFDILRELEIEHIFGVPGTNEIPIIDGCDAPENQGKVTYVECLHENIALGAATGYARMTGKVGVVEVHVTPGIGHCLGNLYNAWKSRVPLVVLCGQQQNELVTQEPLLASNLVQVAGQYTKWSHELRAWEEIPLVLQRAFKEAMAPPAGPVFISLPWDFIVHAIPDDARVRGVTRIPPRFTGDPAAVADAAKLLAAARKPVIICGDAVGYAGAWDELKETAELLGAPVYLEGMSGLANFPNDDYHWQGELPGSQGSTQALLKPHDVAFLCGFGLQAQLAVFKYSDGPLIPPTVRQVALDNNTWNLGKNHYAEAAVLGDVKATLPHLNDAIRAAKPKGAAERNTRLRKAAKSRAAAWAAYLQQAREAEKPWGALVAETLRRAIKKRKLAERFVYVHEAISDASSFQMLLPFGQSGSPNSYYCVGGGSLGWSMPASLGVALARGRGEDEPWLVVNAVGDGSSLFYPQVWWTAAHRELSVLYVIMNNREYHTLQVGLGQVVQAYGDAPGFGWHPVTDDPSYLHIQDPEVDFASIAAAFGVPDGRVVRRSDELEAAFAEAIDHVLAGKGSYVLDVRTDQAAAGTPAQQPTSAAKRGVKARAGQPPAPPTLAAFHEENDAKDGSAATPARHGGAQVLF